MARSICLSAESKTPRFRSFETRQMLLLRSASVFASTQLGVSLKDSEVSVQGVSVSMLRGSETDLPKFLWLSSQTGCCVVV